MVREDPPDPDRDQRGPFPAVRAVHDAIRVDPEAYPGGWVEQVQFRERYDLPPFRPPRFVDGAPVHETVSGVESRHEVDVEFAAYAPGEWLVELDGERAFRVARRRDDAANTVVQCSASEFRDRVERAIEGDGDSRAGESTSRP